MRLHVDGVQYKHMIYVLPVTPHVNLTFVVPALPRIKAREIVHAFGCGTFNQRWH